jgi:hypothetical protein
MAELHGDLIYEYRIQSTGITAYGVPELEVLLIDSTQIPPQGGRYDLTFEGPIDGPRLRGTVKLADYVEIRPDRLVQEHVHAEITTGDGKKIALHANGTVGFSGGPSVGEIWEGATLMTAEPEYAWVNSQPVWARGTIDLAKGEAHITGYVV